MSAASRRLHISQPALSQTVSSLELRLAVPIELPPDLLERTLAKFSANRSDTRVIPRHLSTAAQLSALRGGELDVGLVRERPAGEAFDAMLVLRENLGVLLASELAAGMIGPDGVRLDGLSGLQWLGFPRSNSPAWHDELTSIFRSHGIDIGPAPPEDQLLIPAVRLAAVSAGRSFALAPEHWPHPLPDSVRWSPLVDHPLVRRTWVVWPASSRRRDIGQLVTAFEMPRDYGELHR